MQTTITIEGVDYSVNVLTIREYLNIVSSYQAGEDHNYIPTILSDRFGVLPKHLAEIALVKLIAVSRRKDIKMSSNCPACGKPHEFTVHPSTIMSTETEELKHTVGQIVINMRYPELYEDDDLFGMLDRCIVSFFVADQTINWKDCPDRDKDDLFKMLTLTDVETMIEKLLKPKVYAATVVTCECGESWPAVTYGAEKLLKSMGIK